MTNSNGTIVVKLPTLITWSESSLVNLFFLNGQKSNNAVYNGNFH
jgi:hypothetical protein